MFAGEEAWDGWQHAGPRLILPPESNPSDHSWPVRGLEVLLCHMGICEEERLEQLADRLLQYGATVVRILTPLAEGGLAILKGDRGGDRGQGSTDHQ